jgi:hypothetical protein
MGSDSAHSRAGEQFSLGDVAASRFSRRQLLRRSALALGGITGAGLFDPAPVFASTTAAPRPIPGGLSFATGQFVGSGADLHFALPGFGFEMSTITDFIGVLGGSETQGNAVGSDGAKYSFDCDMRFMQGLYIGLDGRPRFGSFGFI